MLFSFFSTAALVAALFISDTSAQSVNKTYAKNRAAQAAYSLEQWYDGNSGLWETTGWWNAANIMTMIGNLAKADPKNEYVQTLARTVFKVAFQHARTKNPNPEIEKPDNSSSKLRSKSVGTGYHKAFDSVTHTMQTIYPADWSISSDHNVNLTAIATSFESSSVDISFTPNPYDFLDGYYDDDLWWALAWITAYDVTKYRPYLTLAEGIFKAVSTVWPSRCKHGGIYWNSDEDYVNAIANGLFISTAAHLANRVEDRTYFEDWAKNSEWWFYLSGMKSGNDTINDGLNDKCYNNGGIIWSYNQGVYLGALVEMTKMKMFAGTTQGLLLAKRALSIARAALETLADENGILHDVCEPQNCGADGSQFKGIFMRNLVELHRARPTWGFGAVIKKNADSIWRKNKYVDQNGRVTFGVDWAQFVGTADASTHSSAMDALVAAIWVERGMNETA